VKLTEKVFAEFVFHWSVQFVKTKYKKTNGCAK